MEIIDSTMGDAITNTLNHEVYRDDTPGNKTPITREDVPPTPAEWRRMAALVEKYRPFY